MINRRTLLRGGLAVVTTPFIGGIFSSTAFGQANFSKQIGIQVWDMDLISSGLRPLVEKAIKTDLDNISPCLNGYTFARTVGGKLRDAENDVPNGTPGMRYDGLVVGIVDSIETDEKCGLISERNSFDLAITGGIIEHRRPFDDVNGRHLRFRFPDLASLGYKVLYPHKLPGSERPETRLFAWEWFKEKGKSEQWRRSSIHVVVQAIK